MQPLRIAMIMALSIASGAASAEEGERPRVHLQDIPWVDRASEVPTRVPGASGSGKEMRVRVARIHRTGDTTHAAVNVQNTSSSEFHDITVTCTAYDPQGRSIGTRQAALDRDRSGTIRPGFAADLDFVFATPKEEVRALSCDAHGRGMPRRVD